MEVPETTSALRNVLVLIVTHPSIPSELVADAANLIALDARFDDWFLRVAKRTASAQQIEDLLQLTDDATSAIEAAWAEFDASNSSEQVRVLGQLLASSVSKFRSVLPAERGSPLT